MQPADKMPADIYVYRDTGEEQASPAEGPRAPDEHDAAYWYDLSGQDPGPVPEEKGETRGPFEPLVSSAGPPPGAAPPGAAPPGAAPPGAAPPGAAPPGTGSAAGEAGPAEQNAAGDAGREDPMHVHAQKLEQIKDFYLTAEAIGEENVDRHFDQLMAQQRALINEYFRHSAAPGAQADQDEPGSTGESNPAQSTDVRAEQPRTW